MTATKAQKAPKAAVKRVLRLMEHHGDVYLDISTAELEGAAALSIIRGRFRVGNNYYGPIQAPRPPKEPSYTMDQIASMPDGPVRAAAMSEHEDYGSNKAQYDRDMHGYTLLQKARDGDAKAAIRFLQGRKNFEDEEYQIIDIKSRYPSNQ